MGGARRRQAARIRPQEDAVRKRGAPLQAIARQRSAFKRQNHDWRAADGDKLMAEVSHPFISVDDHVQEHPSVWLDRLPKSRWGDRVPHLEGNGAGGQW